LRLTVVVITTIDGEEILRHYAGDTSSMIEEAFARGYFRIDSESDTQYLPIGAVRRVTVAPGGGR
jgi:hypothetical protein